MELWSYGVSTTLWQNSSQGLGQELGVMELWSYGVMELWSYGVMELWSYGVSTTLWQNSS